MFHIVVHFSFVIFPVTILLLLLNRTDQKMLLMDRLLLFCDLYFVEVSEIERLDIGWVLIVQFSIPVELIVLESALICYFSWGVVQLAIPMHKVLVKVAYVEPARREIKLSLSLFLSLDIHRPNILRLFHFCRFGWILGLLIGFLKRNRIVRLHQIHLWTDFFHTRGISQILWIQVMSVLFVRKGNCLFLMVKVTVLVLVYDLRLMFLLGLLFFWVLLCCCFWIKLFGYIWSGFTINFQFDLGLGLRVLFLHYWLEWWIFIIRMEILVAKLKFQITKLLRQKRVVSFALLNNRLFIFLVWLNDIGLNLCYILWQHDLFQGWIWLWGFERYFFTLSFLHGPSLVFIRWLRRIQIGWLIFIMFVSWGIQGWPLINLRRTDITIWHFSNLGRINLRENWICRQDSTPLVCFLSEYIRKNCQYTVCFCKLKVIFNAWLSGYLRRNDFSDDFNWRRWKVLFLFERTYWFVLITPWINSASLLIFIHEHSRFHSLGWSFIIPETMEQNLLWFISLKCINSFLCLGELLFSNFGILSRIFMLYFFIIFYLFQRSNGRDFRGI